MSARNFTLLIIVILVGFLQLLLYQECKKLEAKIQSLDKRVDKLYEVCSK